ncbi:MAG TPA: prepilin-type N-terminal cleavage/methylation domain-containing protein [Polyangiaceae bacterium]|nr:prepilin-type N-terminal cleavage/methylation domain-containing protein [Polyangiaceae bacterium]
MSAERPRAATRRRSTRRRSTGFTLVELMVALTGGLFLSLAVFALARDSGRFYQREARLANATVSGLIGFQRLRADLARAGFLSTPNIFRDTSGVCGAPNATWPVGLRNLASIRLSEPDVKYDALTLNGRTPPVITLAGSYSSPDVFGAKVVPAGNNVILMLSTVEGASGLRRLGNGAMPDNATMNATFPALRVLRIVQNGKQYYGQIVSAAGGVQPTVTINSQPPIQFHSDNPLCGLREIGSGNAVSTINVVNFIQYAVRPPQTPLAIDGYRNLFANSSDAPGEAGRTELTRVELDLNGQVINGTEEIVAEYAVDLNLQVIAVTSFTGASLTDPNVSIVSPGDAQFGTFTGPVFLTGNTPELIRSVRVRLGVRSREGDRTETLSNPATQGLFRFNIGSDIAEGFARVRTFQADVALHNQASVVW